MSIDDYFTNEQGKYFFKYRENHLAYKNCEERVGNAMQQGINKIFVDNTFTMDWEFEPYFKLCSGLNYLLFVVTVENYHGGHNTHQISRDQLLKMAAKYKVKLL